MAQLSFSYHIQQRFFPLLGLYSNDIEFASR